MSTPQQQDWQQLVTERGGAPVTVYSLAAGSGQLVTGIGLIIAITGSNTSTTAGARYRIYDGVDTTGPCIASIGMPASGGEMAGLFPPGIYFGQGLYLSKLSSPADITVTYVPLFYPLK